MAASTGGGATLTWGGTPALTGVEVREIAFSGFTHEALDVTHLGTTTWMEKLTADTTDPGTVTITFLFDPDDATNLLTSLPGDKALLTITFQTSDTLSGTAIITGVTPPTLVSNGINEGTIEFAFDGGYNSGTAPIHASA